MNRHCVTGLGVLCLAGLASVALWTTHAQRTRAHCQVPCGIYDDTARISRMMEDATTIAKAIGKINELAGGHDAQSVNQAARWVATKESHASNIIDVVALYFLTQKVKPVAPGTAGHLPYLEKLADHHRVMVAAMKTKQTVSTAAAEDLKKALSKLAKHY